MAAMVNPDIVTRPPQGPVRLLLPLLPEGAELQMRGGKVLGQQPLVVPFELRLLPEPVG